jgi:acetylornithine deacetylase
VSFVRFRDITECSGYPELGDSAIEHLVSCLSALLETEWPSSPKFGKTTVNIGTISGGAAANIVPANATAALSIRVATDLDETTQLLRSIVGKHDGVKLTIDVSLPVVPLDSDVGGFQTIVVSYFTVFHILCC